MIAIIINIEIVERRRKINYANAVASSAVAPYTHTHTPYTHDVFKELF